MDRQSPEIQRFLFQRIWSVCSGIFRHDDLPFLSGLNSDTIIVSAVMPLVPGVTFTTAIRDTLNGDYAAGSARILEAIVVGLAVAFGVGAGLLVVRSMEGGLL